MSANKIIEAKKVQLGSESYDDRFAAFLKNTNQKKLIAVIMEELLVQLNEKTDFFAGDSLSILDVGCGEGTLAKQLVPAIRSVYPENTIHYTGLDFNESFVARFGDALSTFENVDVEAFKSDAFSDKAFPVDDTDVTLASHMIYHSYIPNDAIESREKAQNFMSNTINALGKDGIAIMIHEAGNSDMRQIGTKYGSDLMPNATDVILETCETPVLTLPFDAELTFPKIKPGWWDMLSNTKTMAIARQIPEMNEVLHLLGFIVQRDFAEMEANDELAPFVAEVQAKLSKSDNHCLTVRSHIQIGLSKEVGIDFAETISSCCDVIKERIPALEKEHSLARVLEMSL